MPSRYESDYHELFSDDDVRRVVEASAKFKEAAEANLLAIRSAEHAVAMTMSWVGAGERLVAVTKTLIDRELAKPNEPQENKDRLAGLQGKLGELAMLANSLKGLYPTGLG